MSDVDDPMAAEFDTVAAQVSAPPPPTGPSTPSA
jgi:hypothetical protein